MTGARTVLRAAVAKWNAFFFAPVDLRYLAAFRALYGALAALNLGVLALDLPLLFGPDSVMPLDASRQIIDASSRSVFELLPDSMPVLWTGLGLGFTHAVLLAVGWLPRMQAFGVFFWMLALHNRNVLIFDGEDQVFRLFAFFLVFAPTHHHFSVDAWLRARRARAAGVPAAAPRFGPAWAARFVEIQMTLVYFGAAWAKAEGPEWRDGSALWYISRLDDVWGRFPMPDAPFDSLAVVRLMTWGTLAFELALPVLLWVRRTRRIAIVVALLFHLALDYAMNLFLFHPLMAAGLLCFVASERGRAQRGA